MRTPRSLIAVTLLVTAACGGGGEKCAPTGSCGTPPPAQVNPTYAVSLASAPTTLGAIVVGIDGQVPLELTTSVPASVNHHEAATNSQRTAWRALFAGPLPLGTFLVLRASGPCDATPPRVQVVEAATGRAGGYASIPATQITPTVTRTACGS